MDVHTKNENEEYVQSRKSNDFIIKCAELNSKPTTILIALQKQDMQYNHTLKSIANKKSYQKRLNSQKGNIITDSNLKHALVGHHVATIEEFNNIPDDSSQLMVLKLFNGTTTTTNFYEDDRCEGFYFTSKSCILLLKEKIEEVNDINSNIVMIPVGTDGTYKLLLIGWTMILLTVTIVKYCKERKIFNHSALPLVYGFVKTESEASYNGLYNSLKFMGMFKHYYIYIYIYLIIYNTTS